MSKAGLPTILLAALLAGIALATVAAAEPAPVSPIPGEERNATSRSPGADIDELFEALRQNARADWKRYTGMFCRDAERTANGYADESDRRAALRMAEELCARCKQTRCPEYQAWLILYTYIKAVEIRRDQRRCLAQSPEKRDQLRCSYVLGYPLPAE